MVTGVGFLEPEMQRSGGREWREMTDCDASHSSESRLFRSMTDVSLFLSVSFSFLLSFIMLTLLLFCFCFYLDRSFCLPVGHHPPNG
jgi:hypothetical protein